MRPYYYYYIVSGILLITDFAVAAPVLAQEKRQAGVDVVHMPLKRGDELSELWLDFLRSDFAKGAKPKESSATRPLSSSQSSISPPSGPAHGSTGVVQPPPSMPGAPLPMSISDHAPSSADVVHMPLKRGDELSELWLDFLKYDFAKGAKPKESSVTRPSSSSQSSISPPSGPAHGSTGVVQPPLSMPGAPLPMSISDHAPSSADVVHMPLKRGDELSELWLDYLRSDFAKGAKLKESSATRPSSSSQSSISPPSGPAHGSTGPPPLEPAHGSTGVMRPPPSMPGAPLPLSISDHAPSSAGSPGQIDLEEEAPGLKSSKMSEQGLKRLMDISSQ